MLTKLSLFLYTEPQAPYFWPLSAYLFEEPFFDEPSLYCFTDSWLAFLRNQMKREKGRKKINLCGNSIKSFLTCLCIQGSWCRSGSRQKKLSGSIEVQILAPFLITLVSKTANEYHQEAQYIQKIE